MNARADWFVKLRISRAIYLRATREKMAVWFVKNNNINNALFTLTTKRHIYMATTVN